MMDSEEEGGEANSSIYSTFLTLHLFFGFYHTFFYLSALKGTASPEWHGFFRHVLIDLALKKGRGWFLILFWVPPIFHFEINIILPGLMRKRVGWIMLATCTSLLFSCFLLVSRCRNIYSGTGPRFSLAGGFCKLYANDGRKLPIQGHPLWIRHLRASHSVFIIG
jgi:hypothetical protein